MTETTTSPLRSATEWAAQRPWLVGGISGCLLGAIVTAGVFWYVLYQRQRAYEAQLINLGLQVTPTGITGSLFGVGIDVGAGGMGISVGGNGRGGTYQGTEKEVLEVGKEFVGDLENLRLVSAYRSLSSALRSKTERTAFEAEIAKFPTIRELVSEYSRQYKVRKALDGVGYEFYCTARTVNYPQFTVNVALTLMKEDNAWRVSEFEISDDKKQ